MSRRITIEFLDKVDDLLMDLVSKSGLNSVTDVLKVGLGLLNLVVDTVAGGGKVVIHHPDGTTEDILACDLIEGA
jgi:hypothetical protein